MTEEELAEELSELEQALSALEGEALYGASPGGGGSGGASMSPGASLDRDLAEKLGLAQGDEADPSGGCLSLFFVVLLCWGEHIGGGQVIMQGGQMHMPA